MPWDPSEAKGKTTKAKSATAKRQWAHVANQALGSGKSEASAIKMANAVVKKRGRKKR
jgi:hypothetical protein